MNWNERLRSAISEKGWSNAELARRSGVSYDSVSKYVKGGVSQPRGDTFEVLARALDVDPLWLEKGIEPHGVGRSSDTRSVTVIGPVQAGYWTEAFEWEDSDQYDVHINADDDIRPFKLYGAELRGASMDKWRPAGTIIIFTDQIDTGEELRAGSRYVVERRNSAGEHECTVKTFWLDEDGEPWLLPESNDPRFQEPIKINGLDGDTIRIMGRVVYTVSKEP